MGDCSVWYATNEADVLYAERGAARPLKRTWTSAANRRLHARSQRIATFSSRNSTPPPSPRDSPRSPLSRSLSAERCRQMMHAFFAAWMRQHQRLCMR